MKMFTLTKTHDLAMVSYSINLNSMVAFKDNFSHENFAYVDFAHVELFFHPLSGKLIYKPVMSPSPSSVCQSTSGAGKSCLLIYLFVCLFICLFCPLLGMGEEM